MKRWLVLLLIPLLGCMEAQAQVYPTSSKEDSRELASAPLGSLRFAMASATAPACLVDAAGPVYFPEGSTIRIEAESQAFVFFTQAAAGDLTFTAATMQVDDAATACGIGGASACPNGPVPGIALGAGGVDYQVFPSFTPRGGQAMIGARAGVCETTGGGTSAVETARPCRQDSDCDVTGFLACDLQPDRMFGPRGGFVCGVAASSAATVTWY